MISQQREIGDSYETRMKIKGILTDWLNVRQISRKVGKDVRSVRRIIWRMEQLNEIRTKTVGCTNYYKLKVLTREFRY